MIGKTGELSKRLYPVQNQVKNQEPAKNMAAVLLKLRIS